jgi:hypothetical protein
MRMQKPLFAAHRALSMTLNDIPKFRAAKRRGEPVPTRLSYTAPYVRAQARGPHDLLNSYMMDFQGGSLAECT